MFINKLTMEVTRLLTSNGMDQEIIKKIEEQGLKIDAIYKSVEKTRKYFLTIIWVTVLAFILPMIGLAFVVPSFLGNYTSALIDFGL